MTHVKLNYLGPDVKGKTFTHCHFHLGKNMPQDWQGCVFYQCEFTGTAPPNINWQQCIWHDCRFEKVKLGRQLIKNCCWYLCELIDSYWKKVVFEACQFSGCQFNQCLWRKCCADGVTWLDTRLAGLSHHQCLWQRCGWHQSDFCGDLGSVKESTFVDSTIVNLGDPHLPLDRLQFENCNMSCVQLEGAILNNSGWQNCDTSRFTAHDVTASGFSMAESEEGALSAERSYLPNANFSGFSCKGAGYCDADSRESSWRHARVQRMSFQDAKFDYASVVDTDYERNQFSTIQWKKMVAAPKSLQDAEQWFGMIGERL